VGEPQIPHQCPLHILKKKFPQVFAQHSSRYTILNFAKYATSPREYIFPQPQRFKVLNTDAKRFDNLSLQKLPKNQKMNKDL
jgi:hypothetical protein